MDRIERQLSELLGAQSWVSYYVRVEGTIGRGKRHAERRTALRTQIAADWRAMVEALEQYMEQTYVRAMISVCNQEDDEAFWQDHVAPIEADAYDTAESILARVKGEENCPTCLNEGTVTINGIEGHCPDCGGEPGA